MKKIYIVAVRIDNETELFEFKTERHRESFLNILRKDKVSFATTEMVSR